jgi:GntR family transcriptional regulator, arabinose operon transcriptional repressor
MDVTSGPLYQQIVDRVSEQIQSGTYRPGDKLPSERALCDDFRVSQITVRRALRELAHAGLVYSRHGLGWYVAAAVRSNVQTDVALLLSCEDPMLGALLPPCMAALDQAGIRAQALFCRGQGAGLDETLGLLNGLGPRAVLWGVAGPEQELGARYGALAQAGGLPGLLLPRQIEGLDLPAIVLDERAGVAQVTTYLMSQGHRRIAYIGGDPSLAEGWRRYWGFASAIWEGGLDLPLDWVLAVSEGQAISEDWLAQVFAGAQRPTALACATDQLAAEALHDLRALGLRCPDQVAIAGMGADPLGAYLSPPLTTFRLDTQAWAVAVARATRALLEGQRPETQVLSGELVIRDSCAAPPGSA